MTSLFDLETQLQAAVRDIELLRNDIRSAFDGLDTQGRSIAATHTRMDTAFDQVSARITEIDQAHGQQYLDQHSRIQSLRASVGRIQEQHNREALTQPNPQDYRRAYGVAGAKTIDEYEARRSMETAAERGNRPPERGETVTVISCLWFVANGHKDCEERWNTVSVAQWCQLCRRANQS